MTLRRGREPNAPVRKWHRVNRLWWLAVVLIYGCGPSLGAESKGEDGGGASVADWQPPDDEAAQPGPRNLAMATDGDTERLVAFADRGVVIPWGTPLPPPEGDVRPFLLRWQPEHQRGAVLRRGNGDSEVFALDGQRLRRIGADLPNVEWIEMSREGWLVVLSHEDGSTTVVSLDDEIVLELDGGTHPDEVDFVGFGDGDTWALWSHQVDPDATFSARDYWVHDFRVGTTRPLRTLPFGSARWFTFETSVLLQRGNDAEDSVWLDLTGSELGVAGMPTTRVGPNRHAFADGRAFHLSDRAVTDIGPQPMVPGYVAGYVPGQYAIVGASPNVELLSADGVGDAAVTGGSTHGWDVHRVFTDPLAPQVVVSRHDDGEPYDQSIYQLWRPRAGQNVYLGLDYAHATNRFVEDGTLLRLLDNGQLTAVMPDGDEVVELDTSPWSIAFFSIAHEVDRRSAQRRVPD